MALAASRFVLRLPPVKLSQRCNFFTTRFVCFPLMNYCIPRARRSSDEEARFDGGDLSARTFDVAVRLFNVGDYYTCHDVLEELWVDAEEPDVRTLLHGLLQCAVGLHHLLNQNHRGAMMELGEGLCKLRKMEFDEGPFREFEKDVAAALEFFYHTQMELAACTDDVCVTMDGSERSYQLLGSFGAGQQLYSIDFARDCFTYIVFGRGSTSDLENLPRVKVPKLYASEEQLKACRRW